MLIKFLQFLVDILCLALVSFSIISYYEKFLAKSKYKKIKYVSVASLKYMNFHEKYINYFINTFGEDAEVDPYDIIKDEKDKSTLMENFKLSLFKKLHLTGEFIGYYKNGNIDCKVSYVNGKLNGAFVQYYDSGSIWFETNYKNGFEHGKSFGYDEYGNMTMILYYFYGIKIWSKVV